MTLYRHEKSAERALGFYLGALFLLIAILLPSATRAQSSLESMLPGGGSSLAEGESSANFPQINDLNGSWWGWLLDDDGKVDADRAKELITSAKALDEAAEGPGEQAVEALDQTLVAIVELEAKVSDEIESGQELPNTPITFQAFFDLVSARAELSNEISSQERQADVSNALRKQMDADHNRLTSQYRNLESSSERQLAGLQQMASRARLEHVQRRVSFFEQSLESLEKQFRQLSSVISDADLGDLEIHSKLELWSAERNADTLANPFSAADLVLGDESVLKVLSASSLELNRGRTSLVQSLLKDKARPEQTNAGLDATASENAELRRVISRAVGQGKQTLIAAEGMVPPNTAATASAFVELREELAKSQALLNLTAANAGNQAGGIGSAKAWLFGTYDSARTQLSWVDNTLFSVNETAVTTLSLLKVLMIFGAFWLFTSVTTNAFARLKRRKKISAAGAYTLSRVVKYVLLTMGFLIAMSAIGIDLSKFALFISALGIGLGFGLQAIISNFVSGIIILFERSLRVGDFVELESGPTGKVRDINIRGTLVTTNDNIDILIPNSEFVSGRVTNWTLRDSNKRLRIPFGVAYGSDKETVKEAALEAAATVPFTLDNPKTQVWLMAFGDSSLNFELVVWVSGDAVARPAAVQAAYVWALDTALREHDIEIPFPQQDLHVRSYFGLEGKDAVEAMADPDAALEEGLIEPSETEDEQSAGHSSKSASENDAARDAMEGIEEAKKEKRDREKAELEADEKSSDDESSQRQDAA